MGIYLRTVQDAAYALLTADTGTTGPAYNAWVDVPGIRNITIGQDDGDEQTLEGDGGVLQSSRTEGAFTGSMEVAGMPLAVLAALLDMQAVTTGTGATEVRTIYPKDTVNLPYFKLGVQGPASDGGDVRAIVYKAKLLPKTMPELVFAQGEYATLTLDFTYERTVSTIADAAHNLTATRLLVDIQQRASVGTAQS